MVASSSSLHFPEWGAPDNIVAAYTTRDGGVSTGNFSSFNLGLHVGEDLALVAENRRRLAAMLNPGLYFHWLDQVHGTEVVEARRSGVPRIADAVVCREPGIVCSVATADCLAVFLASKDGHEVALAHAGWRGLAGGILENTVAALKTAPDRCVALLGPAIGPCHFEVGAEVREKFTEHAPSHQVAAVERCFTATGARDKYLADLFGLAWLKLLNLGIRDLSSDRSCTYCDAQRFYSYRRQPVTGRMLNLIYIKP